MSSILRNGWHPKGKGEGGKESWRSDFKGINQVARLTGRGKDSSATGAQAGLNHSSAPLSTLKDPASFGPPPKHVAAYGAQPESPSSSTRTTVQSTPQVTAASRAISEPVWQNPQSTASPQRPRPALPPRQNSRPDANTPEPPPSYDAAVIESEEKHGYINQAAVDRLGKANVDVSAFKSIKSHTGSELIAPSVSSYARRGDRSSEQHGRVFQQQRMTDSWVEEQHHGSGRAGPRKQSELTQEETSTNQTSDSGNSRRRPPPPPPPKKKELKASQSATGSEPPPIPTSSKPRF